MNMNIWWFAGLFVAVVIIANILAVRRRKARVDATQSFAQLHGFRREGDVNPFTDFKTGMLNQRGTVRNVLRGATAAGEAMVLDYMPSAAETDNPMFATYALFDKPGIPDFLLMPRARFTIGIKAIEFTSHPRFNKRFTLTADDEASVRSLFSSSVLGACEALSDKKGWQVQARSGRLFLTYGLAEADELPRLVEESARVAAAMRS